MVSFVAMLSITAWLWTVLQEFNSENQRYAQGVCCGLIEPVLDAVQKIHRTEPIDFSKGYVGALAAWWLEYWDRQPQALLWLSQTAHMVSGWLIFFFGWRWRMPLMGAMSGIALLLTPVLLYTTVRWDIYALQGPLLILALIVGYGSKGFSSIVHCALYAGIVWLSAFWSYRETDNIILLLTEGSLAFGFWSSALWFGEDSENRPISRRWSVIFGLLTCSLLIWQIAQYWRFTSPEGIQYYFREADTPMMEPVVQLSATMRWMGYWGHMYWRALGPLLAVCIVTSMAIGVIIRRLPWGMIFGVLIPYAALSIISKRNFYYPSTLWVLMPLMTGFAFRIQRWSIPRMIVLFGGSVALLWSANARIEGTSLAADDTYGGIFQTSDGNLSLKAQRLWGVETLGATILANLTDDGCTEDVFVVLEANAMMEEIALRVVQQRPCVVVKRTLQNKTLSTMEAVQVWVTDPKQHPEREDWLMGQGFNKQEELLMDNRFYLSVWAR